MKKFVLSFLAILMLLLTACNSWMKDDDFYSDIEHDVKVANAHKIDVYVRYAMTKQGKTDPDGFTTFKVEIPQSISAVTETEYGFVRWAAFTTDFLATGDQQSKNKDFIYVSEEDYNTRFLPYEIKSPIVVFEDAKSPSTTVTINEERNDLFIVPVVAQRPTIALTIPAVGSKDVVRNMAVRISFSKPMNPDSFINEEGICDKITITQGNMVISSDGDIDIDSEDITQYFAAPTFSKNSKMITLMFNQDASNTVKSFKAQSTISVIISKEVTDQNGFSMADDEKVSFTVGSNMDSLAPRITQFTGGLGNDFLAFTSMYKDSGTVEQLGILTKITDRRASLDAPVESNGLYDNYYDDNLFAQRVKDKVVLRVVAEDISEGQTETGIESDVTNVSLRAVALYDMSGNPLNQNSPETQDYSFGYASQNNYTSSLSLLYGNAVEEAYKLHYGSVLNATQQAECTTDKSKGVLYEIDLSELPDGLIRIDVAAMDSVQNNGFTDGGSHSAECGNGYASIFVVKDSTPPSTAANSSKIDTVSDTVSYGWYKQDNYQSIKIVKTSDIIDVGHEKLRSKTDKIKWIVKPTTDTSWCDTCSPSDAAWRLTNDTNGYSLGNTTPVDGQIGFTYSLMDDLQNMSEAGEIAGFSVSLDTVSPVLNKLKWEADSGVIAGVATGQMLDTQTLSINFTEVTSGVKTLALNVKKSSEQNECAVPFNNSNLQITYVPEDPNTTSKELVKNTDYKIDTTDSKKIIFTNAYKSGSFKVKGIQLCETQSTSEGSYVVKVKLEDAAINLDSNSMNNGNSKSISLLNDSTKPIIQKISIPGIKKAVSTTGTAEEYWISKDYVQSAAAEAGTLQVPLTITIKENNSGISYVELDGVSNLNNAKIYVRSGNIREEVTDLVTISTSGTKKIITVKDSEDAFNKGTSEETFDLIIENASFTTTENSVSVCVSDVAKNDSAAYSSISSQTGSVNLDNITTFNVDYSLPSTTTDLYDNLQETSVKATAGYTNSVYVDYSIELGELNCFSGINSVVLENATFETTGQNKTAVDIDDSSWTKFVISSDGTTLTFKQDDTNYTVKADSVIKIHNIKLSSTDGEKTPKIKYLTLSERENSKTYTMILDTQKPEWGQSFVYADYTNTASSDVEKIYPHPASNQKVNGHYINDSYYFYTSVNKVTINADGVDSNFNGDDYWYLDSNDSIDIINTYTNGAKAISVSDSVSGTIYLKDKAGNVSDVGTKIKLVSDTRTPSRTFDGSEYTVGTTASVANLMTIQIPQNGKIERNDIKLSHKSSNSDGCSFANKENSYSITTYDYILRKTSDEAPYKIVIKLASGVETTDTLLDGSTNKTFSSYSDLNPTTTSSGVEYYSVSSTYYHYDSSDECNDGFFPYFPTGTSALDGFESGSKYSTSDLCSWHKYEKNTNNEDYCLTSKNAVLKSAVNSDGDIEITIPQNKKMVTPISLLLKDGTGNVEFFSVKPVEMETLNDRRRGSKVGDDSHVNNVLWVVDSGISNVLANNASDGTSRNVIICPYSKEESGSGMFRIDETNTKYYSAKNRASSYQYDSSTRADGNSVTGTIVKNVVNHVNYYNDSAVLDLAIPGGTEPRVFETYTAGYVQEPKYTVKSRLLAVKTTDPVPSQSDFINCTDSTASKWSYCMNTSSDYSNMFHIYPHPDSSWSNNEPYYIYYYVEDAVGNYEINKIVNDKDDKMDLWLYDNEGPVITIRDTTLSPEISGTNINKLLPNNNGYRSHFDGTKGYVHVDSNTRGTKNNNLGTGTTRKVEGAGDDRTNIMFYDIELKSEITGIRAFYYSSSAEAEISNPKSQNNTQGDNGINWYGGYNQTDINAIIGNSYSYGSYEENSFMYGDINYTGKFSGTKINTVIPFGLITSSGTQIYLHVMDWTGNISTYKMGDFKLCDYDSIPKIDSTGGEENQDSCFVEVKTSSKLIELSGSSTGTKKVYMPEICFSDSIGLYGWSIDNSGIDGISFDQTNNRSYVELDSNDYDNIPKQKEFYVYNNVGQSLAVSFDVSKDSIAPDLALHLRSEPSSGSASSYVYQKNIGLNKYPAANNTRNIEIKDCTSLELYDNLGDIKAHSQYVYGNNNSIRFLPKSTELSDSCSLQLFVHKWQDNKWTQVHSSTSKNLNSSLWKPNWVTVPSINVATGAYYRLDLVDRAGNANHAYVYVAQDNAPPLVSVTTAKINTVDGKNYVGVNGVVELTVRDSDSGIKNDGVNDYSATAEWKETSTYSLIDKIKNATGETVTVSNIMDNLNNTLSNYTVSAYNSSKWVYDGDVPEFTINTKSEKQNQYDHNGISDNPQIYITSSNNWGSITIKNTTGNTYSFSVSNVYQFNFTPKFASGKEGDGWYVVKNPTNTTKPDFIEWTDCNLNKDTSYSFEISQWTDSSYYFYPIDKAGNVGDALIITFKAPVEPTFGTPSISNMEIVSSVNYFNKSGSVTVDVKNPSTISGKTNNENISIVGYSIVNGEETIYTNEYTSKVTLQPGNSHSITFDFRNLDDAVLSQIDSSNLTLIVNTEDVTAQKALGKFTYSPNCPSFSLSTVTGYNSSSVTGYAYKKDVTSVMYGSNTASVKLTFEKSSTGGLSITGYATSSTATNWTTSISVSSFTSSVDVYAKDSIGNISSTPLTISFTLDSSVSTPAFSSVGTNNYWKSATSTLYYKSSIDLNVSGDTDVSYFYVDSTTNQSTDGKFTVALTDGEHKIYAVDKVHNVSSPFTFNVVKDNTVSNVTTGTFAFYKKNGDTLGSPVENAAIYTPGTGNTINIIYNGDLVNTARFTPSSITDESGIAEYSYSADGSTWNTAESYVDFDLSTEVRVKAKDNVGNESATPLKISSQIDAGITFSDLKDITYNPFTGNTPSIKGISVSKPNNVIEAKDDLVGPGYTTLFVPENSTFTVTPVSTTGITPVAYAFTNGNSITAVTQPSTFTTIASELSNGKLTLSFPEMTVPHGFTFLWLKDSIGKVTVYNICSNGMSWWQTQKNVTSFDYSVSSDKQTITITGLVNVPIKKIEVNNNSVSITNAKFCFNDNKSYSKTNNFTNLDNNFAGNGEIILTLSNNYSDITSVSVTTVYSSSAISGSFVTRSFGFTTSHYLSGVKDLFTAMKTKVSGNNEKPVKVNTIRLNNNLKTENTAAISTDVSILADETIESTVAVKETKQSKKSKKSNLKEKASAVNYSSASQKSDENYIQMEATAISPAVENVSDYTEINQVSVSTETPKDYSILIYGIISIVMCAVIAMVVIVNKLIVDKTK